MLQMWETFAVRFHRRPMPLPRTAARAEFSVPETMKLEALEQAFFQRTTFTEIR